MNRSSVHWSSGTSTLNDFHQMVLGNTMGDRNLTDRRSLLAVRTKIDPHT
jgi:hypothetical protein